jgi:quercetin dioxygenase-like cupin family protein
MFTYPHTIENKHGEKLMFKEKIIQDGVETLITEGWAQPNAGPPVHVHWKQDESITVVSGKMGTQIPGNEPVFYGPGETATFLRGVWHRFWNAGDDVLHIKGWVRPPNNLEYFLKHMYEALDKGKNGRPDNSDAAFLMTRYKSEFDMSGIPGFVKKIIIPATYFFGKIGGKYRKFKDAPEPLK